MRFLPFRERIVLARLTPFAAICGGILLFGIQSLARPAQPTDAPPTTRTSADESVNPLRNFRGSTISLSGYRGNNCSAASCHGSQGIQGPDGKEHVIWTSEDAHSKAYSVLFNERSVKMLKLLSEGDRDAYPKGVLAHETSLCLKCHGLSAANGTPIGVKSELHSEGVTCEACHGASEKWYTVHYQDFWKGLSNEEKATKYGLLPTKDLVWRTAMCASCHVGAPDMDMNHDLIAAGHPALRTEMSAFHNHPEYGLHWSEKGYGKDFQTRLWLIGQVGTMKASLELTRDRAKRAEIGKAPWPELSESNCFSCHHDLKGGNVRKPLELAAPFDPKNAGGIEPPSVAASVGEWTPDSWRSRPEIVGFRPKGVKLGSVPWGTWYMPLGDVLRRNTDIPVPNELRNSTEPMFGKMNELMHGSYPAPKAVVAETTQKIL